MKAQSNGMHGPKKRAIKKNKYQFIFQGFLKICRMMAVLELWKGELCTLNMDRSDGRIEPSTSNENELFRGR